VGVEESVCNLWNRGVETLGLGKRILRGGKEQQEAAARREREKEEEKQKHCD
jgi:hypothetical protein